MKELKKFLKGFLITYVTISFVVLDFNFCNWNKLIRLGLILTSLVLYLLVYFDDYVEEIKKKVQKQNENN